MNHSLLTTTSVHNYERNFLIPDVKDLKLLADFRAVKLRWSYEHSEANEPASFDIR